MKDRTWAIVRIDVRSRYALGTYRRRSRSVSMPASARAAARRGPIPLTNWTGCRAPEDELRGEWIMTR
jgi:hypothetical protein